MKRPLRWQRQTHYWNFLGGTVLVLFLLVTLAGYAGASQESSIGRYGPIYAAFACVVLGSLVFYFAAAILSHFLPEPRLWTSAINGAIYAAAYWHAFGLSTEPSRLAALTGMLPALALLISALLLRRANPTPQTGAPPEGGKPLG